MRLIAIEKQPCRQSPASAGAPIPLPELLAELCAATSMIMDRAECEVLVREIEQERRTRTFAA